MTKEIRFPDKFLWGAATASYQVEGAVNEGGRGASIWDAFSHTPGKTKNGETGDVAIDHYHRYKEDVALMKSMGLKAYRFSIAWPRIIPAGVGAVNEEGVQFYNNLINELLANGIEPMATLYHWDLPLALQTEFDGFLGEQIHEHFALYARVCFERFGDRVKNWITMNEPWVANYMGFGTGMLAPGRKHNKHVEPYVAGHNMLLAHARAVEVYRQEFQQTQGGQIGITLSAEWKEPGPTDDPEQKKKNIAAAERAMAWSFGWFAEPVYYGDYPQIMKDRCGDRLPKFTEEQKKLLKGSSDFFGLNNYSSNYVKPSPEFEAGTPPPNNNTGSLEADEGVTAYQDPSWVQTGAPWNYVTPWGLKKLCVYIHEKYKPKNGIYITENGSAWPDVTKEEAQQDTQREDCYRQYIANVHEAITEGADVRGYFAWSFFDNYEWSMGYGIRFGMVWVDYETQERVPKKSSYWYKQAIANNGFAV
ncbi:Beta-glucosidase [Phytophthora megakarya]|uniref:beta-glucosidase n=1 Tax=Phytophthora megakarya TaxID=4795 RepID=A0A225WWZ9_9STRA|nr:Beta-glucosidase [Phytophthora megakarya]